MKSHIRTVGVVLMGLSYIAAPAFAESNTAAETKEIEAAPVNCATADGDLRVLAAERKHAEDSKLRGVMAITPAGILAGAVTGTGKENQEILTGEYIKNIDAKTAQIKAKCDK